tara:strand:+ start:2701 stop:3408 length:708 start_codon:yes stop_codon:yes gene_type:complete
MRNFYSFVVPIYNEKKNIAPTINEIEKYFSNEKFEILFVDDNSPDGSADEVNYISSKNQKIRLIQHGKKEGIGAALNYGCKYTNGNLIVFIDADLSQSPKFINDMTLIIHQNYDMVIGSRYMKNSKILNQSLFKKTGSYMFNIFTRFLLKIKLTDITHSFRIFKKKVFIDLEDQLNEKGHPSFTIQLTNLALKNKFKLTEYPITFIERDSSQGVSKLSITKELISSIRLVIRSIL